MARRTEIVGIVVAALIFVFGTIWCAQTFIGYQLTKWINSKASERSAQVHIAGIDVSILTFKVTFKGIEVTKKDSEKIKIDRISLRRLPKQLFFDLLAFKGISLNYASFWASVEGIHVPLRKAKNSEYLKLMNLSEEILLSMEADLEYSEITKTFLFRKLSFGDNRIGTFEVALELSNVNLEKLKDVKNSPKLAQNILLKYLRVGYFDNSLLSRWRYAEYQTKKLDPYKFLNSGSWLPLFPGTEKLADQVLFAVQTFLKEPKSLEIIIAPEKALGMAEVVPRITNIDQLLSLLNLKIKANGADVPREVKPLFARQAPPSRFLASITAQAMNTGAARSQSCRFNKFADQLTQVKRYDEAESTLKKAISTDPTNPQSYIRLASLKNSTGKPAEASALLAQAQKIDPNYQNVDSCRDYK